MRNRARLICAVMAVLVAVFTKDAGADRGTGGDFWEKMSGPGTWKGGFWVFSACFDEDIRAATFQQCNVDEANGWLNLKSSYLTTGARDREEVDYPRLHAISFEPSVDFRIHNLAGTFPVLLGFGTGIHWILGEDVRVTRFSIEPRLSLVLWKFDGAYVGVRYTVKYFYQGFAADDFSDPTGRFDTGGGDGVPSYSFFVSW